MPRIKSKAACATRFNRVFSHTVANMADAKEHTRFYATKAKETADHAEQANHSKAKALAKKARKAEKVANAVHQLSVDLDWKIMKPLAHVRDEKVLFEGLGKGKKLLEKANKLAELVIPAKDENANNESTRPSNGTVFRGRFSGK